MDSKRSITYCLGDVERKNREGYQDPTVFEALSNMKKRKGVQAAGLHLLPVFWGHRREHEESQGL